MKPHEGLGDLHARVAGAFGLTAPFDLVGPEGAPLRSDADAARAAGSPGSAAAGGSPTHVIVAASEEALLDLERAHEESGAMRWALLRQLITGLRTQIAEVVVIVGESKHQAARLDEQLVREQTARESGDASLRVEVQALADGLRGEARRERQELRAAFTAGISDLERRLEELAGRQSAALREEAEVLRQELQGERDDRQRQGDEARRRGEELARCMEQADQAGRRGLEECAAALEKLKAQLDAESKERLAADDRTTKARASLASELRAEFRSALDSASPQRDAQLAKLEAALEDAKKEAQKELNTRASKLEEVHHSTAQKVAAVAKDTDARLAAHHTEVRSYVEGRLAQIGNSEPRVREIVEQEAKLLLVQEASAREAGLQKLRGELEGLQLQERLQQEAAERRAGLDKALAAAASAMEAARSEVKARELAITAAFAGRDEEMHALIGRVQEEERARAADSKALRAETAEACGANGRELEALRAALQELREAAPGQRESLLDEVWRALASQADECSALARQLESCESRIGMELREESGARLAELQRHCEGLTVDAMARMRAEFDDGVQQVEARSLERSKAYTFALKEHRVACDTQARIAAADVKAALDANSEVAAALENSQQLLLEHINKQLEEGDIKQDTSLRRVASLEQDMKKVRGHLPILFASPHAFG